MLLRAIIGSVAVSVFGAGDCFVIPPRNDIFILVVVLLGLFDSFEDGQIAKEFLRLRLLASLFLLAMRQVPIFYSETRVLSPPRRLLKPVSR